MYKTYQSNIGLITILDPPVNKCRLKKSIFDKMWCDLKNINISKNELQCYLLTKKKKRKNIVKIELFLLGYSIGFCGDNQKGISDVGWNQKIRMIKNILEKYTQHLDFYSDKWSSSKKFQARFEIDVQICN